ncbi:DUF4188 domain-containing protein [Georgenia faecalis]|uniref:DUF4188 domain-containing protein n=1 Tax=Georgenia faecalis TaxID=2483799 RepID=A0ABV9D8M3_9MICO|nr:DUF4188 domain-containing protein [Georgenia faecalis]
MRTDDFSQAPPIGQAQAMFVSGTRLSSPRAWLRHARAHAALAARMRTAPGYRGHRRYWQPPATLGTIGWFATEEDLLRFARTGAHRGLADWAAGRSAATGSWVRVYAAETSGYTNGVWRAEGDVMAHIERFTPVGGETVGPPVRRAARGPREP